MKKLLYIGLICLFSFSLIACSEPTLEEDALKAAEYTVLSNQYSRENKMSSSESAYSKMEKIMNKYKRNGKFAEFYELYITFLDDKAIEFSSEDGI